MRDFLDWRPLRDCIENMIDDLYKSENNKNAAQRVRVLSIKLERIAKKFRKDSIDFHKKYKGRRKVLKKARTVLPKKKKAKANRKNKSQNCIPEVA